MKKSAENIIVINYQIISQSLRPNCAHVKLERIHAQCHLLELVYSSDCLLNRNAPRTMPCTNFWTIHSNGERRRKRESERGGRINNMRRICSKLFFLLPQCHMQVIPAKCNFSASLCVEWLLCRAVCILFYFKFNIKRPISGVNEIERNVCYANRRSAFRELNLRILHFISLHSFSLKIHSKSICQQMNAASCSPHGHSVCRNV